MPSPPLAAPNTPKILIVGVGSIGERHLRCFKNTGRCEVAFCETNPSLRAEVADRYGCPGFEDLEEALHQVLEGVEVEDTVNLSLRLRDGTLASFALNQCQVINEPVITFHGTNGSLRIELPSNRVGLVLRGEDTWNWEQLPPTERDIPFTDQALDFLGLLTGQVSHASSLTEAKQTLMANLAALQSDTANQGVEI